VNTAASKRIPSTRACDSAWDDTSMDTARRPESRASARRRWSTGDSGVVLAPSSVPMTVVGHLWAWKIDASRWVTVVLPLVPVTPTVTSDRAG
jgi:hypothetical protein